MKIAFTLCSINYLPQAATLFESLRASNPEWRRIVGLVDRNTAGLDLSFVDAEFLEVENVAIEGFSEMVEAYSIVELITAVKPSYFLHLFEQYPEAEEIVYFDPDIMVFASLNTLSSNLEKHGIVLTPHFTKPINDHLIPTEKHIFRTGVFNLGFLAVRRSSEVEQMLGWWRDRLRHDCRVALAENLFVDQLWMNLVPAYFGSTFIERDPGYNFAHWNLHERSLKESADGLLANDSKLIFIHFSHYDARRPNVIASPHTRYTFESRPDIRKVYGNYHERMMAHRFSELRGVRCHYVHKESTKKWKRVFNTFARRILSDRLKGLIKKNPVWLMLQGRKTPRTS